MTTKRKGMKLVIELQDEDPASVYINTLHAIIDALEGKDSQNYYLCELLRNMVPNFEQASIMLSEPLHQPEDLTLREDQVQ